MNESTALAKIGELEMIYISPDYCPLNKLRTDHLRKKRLATSMSLQNFESIRFEAPSGRYTLQELP